MKVLTVYAHPNPKSLCHAILEQFTKGLEDAGHENETVDLYAIGFDPVVRDRDGPNWIDETVPAEMLDTLNLKQRVLDSAGGPIQRFIASKMLQNKKPLEIIRMIREYRPKDVLEQQEKVARAQGLAFISPVYFVGFPSILKGWIERVWTLGFAFSLRPEGWKGEIGGRIPLLKHEKALIINTTLFNEEAYRAGLGDAMKKVIDDFAFRFPGIKNVEHEYFYAVHSADEQTIRSYLQKAYLLGKEFEH
jgi:NAD(P)H dehydrogenase (quinone)